MNLLKKILIVFVAVLFVLYLGRSFIVKGAVEVGAKAVTGLKLKIGKLGIGAGLNSIQIKDMKLYNPRGFKDKVMVDIPEVAVNINPVALFKGKVHVKELRFNMEQLTIVTNEKGENNLDSLKNTSKKGDAKDKKEKSKAAKKKSKMGFKIDKLFLRVNKVVFKDYSKETPSEKEVIIGLNEEHDNIFSPELLVSTILFKTMIKSGFANLTNIDLDGLGSFVDGGLKGASEAAGKAMEGASEAADKAKESLNKAAEGLKDFNPFGKK